MAIFHLSVKAVSRSSGRSATAAAAYRAGCFIKDQRTKEIHDYRRKGGVVSADIVLPIGAPEWATDRAKLWNAAEMAEKRKDACVAREFEVALPSELSPAERRRLALDFAKEMANEEGCAVDVAIHAPRRISDSELERDPEQHYEIDPDTGQRHNGNHHAHMLRTTRKLEPEGMGAKLDTEKAGRKRSDDLEAVRKKWAKLTNERLRLNGLTVRVDHRNLEMQGIDREPTIHLGPAATGYERRTGLPSQKRMQHEREAQERLTLAKELGELERQSRELDRSIIDLSNDLAAAKAERDRLVEAKPTVAAEIEAKSERDRQLSPEFKQVVAAGMADFRAQFEQAKLVEAGKQQARQAFEQYKAEQQLAKDLAAQAAQVLAKQLEDAERKRQADQERKQPKPGRDGPGFPR